MNNTLHTVSLVGAGPGAGMAQCRRCRLRASQLSKPSGGILDVRQGSAAERAGAPIVL